MTRNIMKQEKDNKIDKTSTATKQDIKKAWHNVPCHRPLNILSLPFTCSTASTMPGRALNTTMTSSNKDNSHDQPQQRRCRLINDNEYKAMTTVGMSTKPTIR
eukprot:scaffold159194_cov20-Prasinocladus_malaysianus.AAC.1